MRVAIASGDGLRVNQHFGHATRFHVFDVEPQGATLLEIRRNEPSCGPTEQSDAHARALDLIADCEALIVSCVGPHAFKLIDARGIRCFETEDLVESTLSELSAITAREGNRSTEGSTP